MQTLWKMTVIKGQNAVLSHPEEADLHSAHSEEGGMWEMVLKRFPQTKVTFKIGCTESWAELVLGVAGRRAGNGARASE